MTFSTFLPANSNVSTDAAIEDIIGVVLVVLMPGEEEKRPEVPVPGATWVEDDIIVGRKDTF